MGGPDLDSPARILGDHVCLWDVPSVVTESFPLSVSNLLSLPVCGIETMCRASTLEVRVDAL